MSKKPRNDQHDELAQQVLTNFLGLTQAAALAEVAAAEVEAVAELVTLANEFQVRFGQWRDQLSQFRAQVAAPVAAAVDAPAPVEVIAGDVAKAGDAHEEATNPAPPAFVSPLADPTGTSGDAGSQGAPSDPASPSGSGTTGDAGSGSDVTPPADPSADQAVAATITPRS
jgi:hypothetical protein